MKIRVLSFASASDAIGRDEVVLEVEDGATVEQLRAILSARYPALVGLWTRLAIAVEGEIAADDRVLSEGAEVALLPPVSGGTGSTTPAKTPARARTDERPPPLTDTVLDPRAAQRTVERPGSGAVLIFVGTVRDHHQGREVKRITYSAYRAMAERRLRLIERELEQERPGLAVCIVHRLGDIEIGEASVVIAVSSAHREDAYDASRLALERIKAEVPIWKREHYGDGTASWREEERLAATESGSSPGRSG